MEQRYMKQAQGEHFDGAREHFEGVVGWLQSGEAGEMTHGDLEERLTQDGRELMRRLLQGHLELRALREQRHASLVGSDNACRSHVRESARELMTVFGPVRVQRLRYSHRSTTSLFPADAALNLPVEKHSHGLRRQAAEHAAKLSYDEVVGGIAQQTAGKVAKRQVEELVERAAIDFEAFYAARAAGAPEATEDPLILSLDGKGIVMRPESLREGTRKAAACSEQKLERRLSRGEKRNRKRMATVAAVYSIVPWVRSPEDVMGELQHVREVADARPRARNKRVWASVERDAKAVTHELFDEAEQRDPEHRRPWVVLVDGDRHQIERVRQEAHRRAVEVTLVLDLIHVLEYLWKAAWCFFEEGDKKAEQWVRERAIRILEGHSSDVAAGIRRSATLRELEPSERKGADSCADYLIAKRDLLHYDEYMSRGLPIASGVIEGACRHLINDRLGITGARWGLKGAETVLRLRSIRSSGDFEDYWRFHLHREQLRNHASCYANQALPQVA